MEQT
jgi:hypothetical protein